VATITLSLPTAGTVITAGLHATNYTAIQGAINGGLDTANWASGKIFAPSKFMQEGAALGNGLVWTGAAWVPVDIPRVYDRLTATGDVNSSVAETSIYTKIIAAGDMALNKMLRLALSGDWLHNNVAADTVTFKVKFGGTTFWSVAANLGNVIGAARHPWSLDLRVQNKAAANVQNIWGSFGSPEFSNQAAPATGIGQAFVTAAGNNFAGLLGISAMGALDTTLAQTLDVTVQWSANSVNNSWRTFSGCLELV
jgi:hypothetical protein